KKEILERYLNTVYFGQGAYGVQAASKVYFGKSVWKVTLREAALLAGLIQATGDYDPYRNGNAAKRRRNVVLRQMADLEYVTEAKAAETRRKGLGLQPVDEKDEYPAPYFVDYVHRLLTYHPDFDFLGKTSAQRTKRLFTGGLRIYTTVDLEMQAAAEDAVAGILTEPGDPYGSLVAIEPRNGHVKAMVGGRNWFAPPKKDKYAKLNLAILAEPGLGRVKVPGTKRYLHQAPGTGRQAGSAFKPFALAAAIEEGVPLSKRYDGSGPLVIPGADNGGDYTVQNYEGGQYGEITLLEATVNSVNVVYAQLVDEIGTDPVVDIAQRMGIRTPLQPFFSAVLGTNEVNPLGMASAYGTLANSGQYHPPVAVTRIVDASNEEKRKEIYRSETDAVDVLDAGAAYLTTSALEEVIRRGTGTHALSVARPAAGKTGTAQEYRDAWFVGYTPNLVAAVWVGYPQGQIEMKTSCLGSTTGTGGIPECLPTRTTVTGGSWPTDIWARFMLQALTDYPVEDFDVPTEGVVTVQIDTRNGCLADKFTPEEYIGTGVFAAGTEPEESCREPGDRKVVENLIGFPRGEAIRILESEGFDVATQAAPLGSYPPGTVVDQDPAGGTKIPAGSTVTLFIASEEVEDTATVPAVTGLTRAEAASRLRSAGFSVQVVVERESSRGQAKKNAGRVWKQAPGEGAELDRGDRVFIWVNPD
ncbi:MAG TPA: PASTA domain-containing protein, partial [Actinomycetota bacterium]|nr:PASTA domain-containing protein [Actinomycetota bacterium]